MFVTSLKERKHAELEQKPTKLLELCLVQNRASFGLALVSNGVRLRAAADDESSSVRGVRAGVRR